VNGGLRHPEAEERRKAVAALSPGEVAHALPDLYALLDDADWRVRREVAHAIARLRDPQPAIEPLVDSVVTGDVARRNAAMEALRTIGHIAGPSVLARYGHTRDAARRFLIEVLADIGGDPAVPALKAALEDPDPNIAHAAAEAIGRISGPSASAALRDALGHADAVVRLAALQAFATRGEVLQWRELEPLLADPLCRRAAIRAAASCPDPRALQAIASALSDRNATLAGEAAIAASLAARHGRRDAIRQALAARPGAARVLGLLAERGAAVEARRGAIDCLGLLADPSAIVVVLHATESNETSAVAGEALDAFRADALPHALGAANGFGANGTEALLRWGLQHAHHGDHAALVRIAWSAIENGHTSVAPWDVIASVGSETDGRNLIAKLRAPQGWLDPNELSRPLVTLVARHPGLSAELAEVAPLTSRLGLLVAAIVAASGHAVPIEPLREALTNPDATVRAAAVRALAVHKEPAARDALEFALADEDANVQAAAAEALGQLGAGQDMLEQSLRAAEPRVRQAAARALAGKGAHARGLLVAALDDPDPAVVLAVMEGLGEHATVEDLVGLTTHRDPDVAAEALVRLRARDVGAAARAAASMLDHDVWSVRLEAVRSMDAANDRDRSALDARLRLERDEMVIEAIESALAGGKTAG
jgi:HEAT repeat protein